MKGNFQFLPHNSLDLPEHQAVQCWLRGLDFPVRLVRQVFTNKDGSAGTL